MALPKLNATPKYEMTVPSTGQKVRYRPYLVKEEKVMLMAFESQDPKNTLNAIVDTIKACVEDEIDTDKLTSFDVEYMFIKLRAKSVGETTTIALKCPDKDCGHKTEVTIDLESIELNVPKNNNVVQITEDIHLELSYPTYKSIAESSSEIKGESPEYALKMIAKSIVSIMTGEERISAKDEPIQELIKFLESMTNSQFTKIGEFFESMPKLEKQIDYRCGKCGKEESVTLRSMEDFF